VEVREGGFGLEDDYQPSFSFSTLACGEETEGKPEPDSSSILNT